MDLCLFAYDHAVSEEAVASALELTTDQVRRVYRDIEAKRRVARYLHANPALLAGE